MPPQARTATYWVDDFSWSSRRTRAAAHALFDVHRELFVRDIVLLMASSLPHSSSGLDNLADSIRDRILKQSRIALAVIGVFTLGYLAYQFNEFNTELDELGPGIREALAPEIAEAHLIMYLSLAVGVLFLGLAACIYRYPLVCTLSGLVIFAASILINAVLDPSTLYQGIIMRVAIVAVLINGVKTARIYTEELKKEKAKHDALATARVVSE